MSNPFALLDDEGASDQDTPQVTSKAAPASKSAASTGKPAAAPAPRNAIPGQASAVRGKPRDDYPGRGGARKVFNEKPANEGGLAEAEPQKREGKGQRGGKTGRSRGGFRTDRHSNTGRTDTEKQEHQGWGINDDGKRELADEQNGWADAKADVSGVGTPRDAASSPAPADGAAPPTEEKAPIVEEDPSKTYDEYLAERDSSSIAEKLGLSALSLRKPNEGADDAQWKNAKEFERKDEEEEVFFAGGSKETKGRKRPQKEGKTFLEVEARFPRPERSDRGGRGRGRGDGSSRGRGDGSSRGRGGDRPRGGPRPTAQKQVDANDTNAFPSLS